MVRWPIFDPHSHIDPHRPAARNLDEVLGYHYYTELAHSAGMPAARVAPSCAPRPAPATSPNTSTRSITPSSIPGCWRSPGPSTVSRTTGSRPRRSSELYDRAEHGRDGAGLGPRGLEPDAARGRLPDQRLRRPARGLGHRASTSPACGPTTWCSSCTSRRPSSGSGASTGVDVQDVATLRQAHRRALRAVRRPRRRACAISLPPDFVPAAGHARSGRRRRSAGPCTRWTSGPTSTTRSAGSSSGRWPSSAPSSGCRST